MTHLSLRLIQESAVKLGINLISKPGKSLPNQTETWGDLKAAYRFLNEEDINYEKLENPP